MQSTIAMAYDVALNAVVNDLDTAIHDLEHATPEDLGEIAGRILDVQKRVDVLRRELVELLDDREAP